MFSGACENVLRTLRKRSQFGTLKKLCAESPLFLALKLSGLSPRQGILHPSTPSKEALPSSSVSRPGPPARAKRT